VEDIEAACAGCGGRGQGTFPNTGPAGLLLLREAILRSGLNAEPPQRPSPADYRLDSINGINQGVRRDKHLPALARPNVPSLAVGVVALLFNCIAGFSEITCSRLGVFFSWRRHIEGHVTRES